ncbi:MAG: Uma2 family endonuclease [Cyanobacteria bacterium P01_A01_bin.116]
MSGFFSSAVPGKWSRAAFHEWAHQHAVEQGKLVELMDGKICPLPDSAQCTRQIQLLQSQIQAHLNSLEADRFEVRSRYPIPIDDCCELKPAITVSELTTHRNITHRDTTHPSSSIPRWVIDITDEDLHDQHLDRRQYFSRIGIPDYWCMDLAQVELRTYQNPTQSTYTTCTLLHIGECASPQSLPRVTIQVQEPTPLHFLTRTTNNRTQAYTTANLPLQVWRS